ncbi:MAG: 16S rRNA (guanine(966)-N(2))-methyltransferase RsmD [Pseudomonadota bacterium]
MRIIGGTWRGRKLAAIAKGDTVTQLRPTSDKLRESLFNILTHGAVQHPIEGARVLDLFAGTGALGLEALSRGAAEAYFVENARGAQELIAQNIAMLDAGPRARIVRHDATKLAPWTLDKFDLVFLDPPYGLNLGTRALTVARDGGWLAPGALVIWEESGTQAAPPHFSALSTRNSGQSWLTFLRHA